MLENKSLKPYFDLFKENETVNIPTAFIFKNMDEIHLFVRVAFDAKCTLHFVNENLTFSYKSEFGSDYAFKNAKRILALYPLIKAGNEKIGKDYMRYIANRLDEI